MDVPSDPPAVPPPGLEELYDDDVLARIDGSGRRGSRPPGVEERYDDDVLARVDGSGRRGSRPPGEGSGAADPGRPPAGRAAIPRYPVARRIGGALLAGAMLGVADVLEPSGAGHEIIDYVPDVPDEDQQLVTFHLVPGDPRASRLVIRPWLLDVLRGGRA